MSLAERFGTDIVISGVAHTPFGKLIDDDLESLIVRVAQEALADAGVAPHDVDAIYLGTFNSGMWPLAFPASLALQAADDLVLKPATRVENACASGAAAAHEAINAILAGRAKTVLVIGAEKMTHAGAAVVGAGLLGADYGMAGKESTTGFAGLFAEVAQAYADRYGDPSAALAKIASKNHANGIHNPWAQLRREFSEEFCATTSERNPMVAAPLRRTDCSPVSDGAAALVLQVAPDAVRPLARVAGIGHANDFLPAQKKDPTEFAGVRESVHQALEMAGITLEDLDFAEVHDCFTIAELLVYEAMGLTERGHGAEALASGTVLPDGGLPINLSGGLKAKGHPVGATGVSQLVLSALQLAGRSPGLQLANPRRGLAQNMGGVAVANYATVLEAM